MSSYLTYLKRTEHHTSCRWIVKYDKEGLIREVKLVYKPSEYRNNKKARILYTQSKLIKILEDDKARRTQILDQVQEKSIESN